MIEAEKAMERREKKEELKHEWEKCFSKKMEDKFTEKGLKKFWDDNTSVEEAVNMLTNAAFDDVFGPIFGDIAKNISSVIVCELKDGDDDVEVNEQDEFKSDDQFEVYCEPEKDFVGVTFDSVDEAKDFIKEKAMNSHKYTVDDFKIVKVYD